MFSGKSTALMQDCINRSDERVFYFKVDYNKVDLNPIPFVPESHNGFQLTSEKLKSKQDNFSFLVGRNFDLINFIKQNKCAVYFVDEVQFLPAKLFFSLNSLVDSLGIDVYCAGLDMDYCRVPFESSAYLSCFASEVVKLYSRCSSCFASDAKYSAKHDGSFGRFDVGGADKYIPVCASCFKLF